MASDSFVHLHLHTEYSLLDGAIRIKKLMEKAKRLGMPAVAMTDHGNLYGAIEFYQAAKKEGINPIIGCEMYLAPTTIDEKKEIPGRKLNSHLTLLATNAAGYASLVRLVSISHLDGQYYKPRIDKEHLAKYTDGIICLSGCISGEINQFLLDEQVDAARASIESFIEIYGKENFYIELHNHGLEQQDIVRPQLIEFAKEYGLKCVAANDVHFLDRADHAGHDVMICIGTNNMIDDERRMHYSEEVYFKTAEEMRELFQEVPGACDATLEIAERCNVVLELDASSIAKYPEFQPEGGQEIGVYFRELCDEGMEKRYGADWKSNTEIVERMNYEIGIMESLGFLSYFIITWDFIKWGRDHGVPVGPGRGSAAGSIVAYALEITDLCPIRFGLIFERFLNPERVSPPDVDIDFCQTRRPEVIQYVREKYGERSVAHICTFGTMGAKSVVRDVGRVMGMSYGDADRISKLIPGELNMTLEKAVEMNPDLKQAIETEPATAALWEHATFLEGLTRNVGVHAAGVVISDVDIDVHCPLSRTNDDVVVTQYAMSPLTDVGMLKMDFLGLKTLTVIHDAVTHIHKHTPDFEVDNTDFDDLLTYELIQRGETAAVFQLESGGMVNLCRQMGVDRIEDIIALIALYRPGPMDLIPDYIDRKKGIKDVKYLHPLLEEVSEETFGILIYQEQVQKAANVLAGYSLGEADILRRAMGKKKVEEMVAQRKKFVAGADKVNGIAPKKADAIFDLLEKFAGYGFNKSHSAAYGLISYQTAYLKANYPVEFMAGVLSNEINNTEKISFFVAECQRMGMDILPPDVNKSDLKFTPDEDSVKAEKRAIRFGLAAIKGVGEGAMEVVLKTRAEGGDFESIEDFANRVDSKSINKKQLESLIKAGAFDFTGEERAALFGRIEAVVSSASATQKDRKAGQDSLFSFDELSAPPPATNANGESLIVPWEKSERLDYEKGLLGFYVTGHPLDDYRSQVESGRYGRISELQQEEDEVEAAARKKADAAAKKRAQANGGKFPFRPAAPKAAYAGIIAGLEVKYTKKDGRAFAIFRLEDFSGATEVMAWPSTYEKHGEKLVTGAVIAVRAKVEIDDRSEMKRLTLDDLRIMKPDRVALVEAGKKRARKLKIAEDAPPPKKKKFAKKKGQAPDPKALLEDALLLRLACGRHTESDLEQIRTVAAQHPGDVPLRLQFTTPSGQRVAVRPSDDFTVALNDQLVEQLAAWM